MRVVIACPAVVRYDAVGTDVVEEYRCLKESGADVYIYAEGRDSSTTHLITDDSLRYLQDEKTVLIYHHAFHWPRGLDLFTNARCKKIVKYHNVTPEHFFLPYSAYHFRSCLLARRQTRELIEAGPDLALFDSRFNMEDFLGEGFPRERCRILAPFTRIDDFDGVKADINTLDGLSDGKPNVFFVGRIVPNKGHRHIIYTAYYYKLLFGDNVRFTITGALDPRLTNYMRELRALIKRLRLEDTVRLAGRVSYEELKAHYIASHAFILTSEHEGFCVPILEAQYFKLPVVAYGAAAVTETIGENQLVYKRLDYEALASSIYSLYRDGAARLYLADEGYRNCRKYSVLSLRERFITCLGGLQ